MDPQSIIPSQERVSDLADSNTNNLQFSGLKIRLINRNQNFKQSRKMSIQPSVNLLGDNWMKHHFHTNADNSKSSACRILPSIFIYLANERSLG